MLHVFGNRDFPLPDSTYPTLLGKGLKTGLGQNISVTGDKELVDENTIYVTHKGKNLQKNAFLHIEGHTHLGMRCKNYLNLGFLYRDDYHGARPFLGCYWELSVENNQLEIEWFNLGGMREINCQIHDSMSFFVPANWSSCPFCYKKEREQMWKRFSGGT